MTSTQRKQLAIGILLGGLTVMLGLTAAPLWSIDATSKESIELLQRRLTGLTQLVDEETILRPQLERLKRNQVSNVRYLASSTETQAAAELQRLVKTISSRNKTTISRTQVLPTMQDQGFARIALKVRMRGPMDGIVHSIYDIEASEPFLFLEDLRLQDTSRRQTAAALAAKQIDAEFELSAYMVSGS